MNTEPLRIAVIGAGVAGITAAYLLGRHHRVTLFEKDTRIGGHTNTVVIEDGPDAGTPVDTGFIVLNNKTYPGLHRLLSSWGVAVRKSNMSFSYYSEPSGLQYAGTNVSGLFAQRANLVRPGFWRFLADIPR
ncbi:MAG: FAD-dependent oxidoreductase, partial [Candidatus Latescibacterota bacterium]